MPDPKFSSPLYCEPTDAPTPEVVLVSASLFDILATTLGASRVEREGDWAFVTYNGIDYKTPLAGAR